MHQDEIPLPGMDPIVRVNGKFKCPECAYEDAAPCNFHRHSHIQAIKKAAEAGEKPSLRRLRSHKSNLSRGSIPSLGPSPSASVHSTPITPSIQLPSVPPSLTASPVIPPAPINPAQSIDPEYQPMDTDGDNMQGSLHFEARELIHPEQFQALQLGLILTIDLWSVRLVIVGYSNLHCSIISERCMGVPPPSPQI